VSNWYLNLKTKFSSVNIVEKIIYINVIVFLVTYLFKTISFLTGLDESFIVTWFALSPYFSSLIIKPWTIISYGFLHEGLIHILFNLFILYFIGNLFLDYFNRKQFLVYYFLGVIFGGIIFMLSYNYFPALKTRETFLVGASAGVTSIIIGIASFIPNYALRFRFIGNIKLLYIAIFLIALDIIQIPNGNAGGHLAHLGGALIGFLLTTKLNKGKSLILWMESLLQPKQKSPLSTIHRREKSSIRKKENSIDRQKKIDRILDKISKSGYDALSKEEKDFLFKVGKE
jgi:membrane associated rhomboid family serine protease